jgi:hypothetical protein
MMNQKLAFFAVSAGLVLGAIGAPSAQAQMNENYAGASANLTLGRGSALDLGVDGRYKVIGLPASARATVNLTHGVGVQATATYDFALNPGTGAYAGVGLRISDLTSAVLQVGAERKLSQNTVVYGGLDYLTRLQVGVAKVGVGYRF